MSITNYSLNVDNNSQLSMTVLAMSEPQTDPTFHVDIFLHITQLLELTATFPQVKQMPFRVRCQARCQVSYF